MLAPLIDLFMIDKEFHFAAHENNVKNQLKLLYGISSYTCFRHFKNAFRLQTHLRQPNSSDELFAKKRFLVIEVSFG